jgi:hypothetical protein
MTIILQLGRGTMHFDLRDRQKRIPLLFFGIDGAAIPDIPLRFRGGANTKENKMKQFLKKTVAPSAALFALAFAAMTPTAASAGEYCRTDVSSAMRSCSFDTMEQCQAMSSGRGGGCARDPFLPDSSNAYAWQPKSSHVKSGIHPAKNPVESR